jgi:hypothetical protein
MWLGSGYWGAMEQKTRLRIQVTSTIEPDGPLSGLVSILSGNFFAKDAFAAGLIQRFELNIQPLILGGHAVRIRQAQVSSSSFGSVQSPGWLPSWL